MNIDFREIEFEHLLAQVFEDETGSLLIVIVDIKGNQHELALTYDQANDVRDMLSLGLMSMMNLDDYENVIRLDGKLEEKSQEADIVLLDESDIEFFHDE